MIVYRVDRGLLGFALHPDYPQQRYAFALMSVNMAVDSDAPNGPLLHPTVETMPECAPTLNPRSECCVSGDTPGLGSCEVTGRLYRLRLNANNEVDEETTLLRGWCHSGSSHHIGDLVFHRDTANGVDGLYVSGGDGAKHLAADTGDAGSICQNPEDPRPQGSFRSQWDEYLDGKILWLPMPSVMKAGGELTRSEYRIVAKGLRNPFRMAVHPTNHDIYVGDVGSMIYEEVNVVRNPHQDGIDESAIPNYGWPCIEGGDSTRGRNSFFTGIEYCQNPIPNYVAPGLFYGRTGPIQTLEVPEQCEPTNPGGSPGGIAFLTSDAFGDDWKNVLFWADSTRGCVFYFQKDADGTPDMTSLHTAFYTPQAERTGPRVVDLTVGRGANDQNTLYMLVYETSSVQTLTFVGDPNNGNIVESKRVPPPLVEKPSEEESSSSIRPIVDTAAAVAAVAIGGLLV